MAIGIKRDKNRKINMSGNKQQHYLEEQRQQKQLSSDLGGLSSSGRGKRQI